MPKTLSIVLVKTTWTIWYISILLMLAVGWASRDRQYLVAETGIGYWLGIIGGSLMLLLLAYPARKRFRRWKSIGSVASWFRIHMILGVVGPLLIVFHSGFRLGSFNSSVAFFSMLIVAISGLVGRSLYQRIHHGLYGSKLRFEEFHSNVDLSGLLVNGSRAIDAAIVKEFNDVETSLSNLHTGVNRSIFFYMRMKSRIWKLYRNINKTALNKQAKRQIYIRLRDLRSICRLGINEVLFSYWHVLHLPLFILLILSGLIHVFVVHFY
ncbi:MAG: pyridine nucleotide-disulfide oxidoreductase [Gammaproteobacteria bacterium]|jgi:hypothetical protein|nr:pyridine nucleotide-disulfide oxidoreductase [Gammaproteobacteria bacterium]